VISGVGFPVTLANKRNVPFSGTFSSSNLSRKRGGSALSNGSSVIEIFELVTNVSFFKVRQTYFIVYISQMCYGRKIHALYWRL
jgi:hypothetical protein